MVMPKDAALMPFPCRDGPALADCPANVALMFLVMERYPSIPRSAWIIAAMFGYFADAAGVVAPEWLDILDFTATRMDIVVSDQIELLVANGWLCPVKNDVAGDAPCAYRISPDWIVTAKKAPPLPMAEDDEMLLDGLELPEVV